MYVLVQPSGNRFTKPLGSRSRRISLVFACLGMVTFFLPIARLDQPISGRTEWSTYNIVMGEWLGTFHPLGYAWEVNSLICYAVLLAAIAVVCFSHSRKTLVSLALFGSWSAVRYFFRWGAWDLGRMFFGYRGRPEAFDRVVAGYGAKQMGLHYSAGAYLLPILMAALLLVSTLEAFDTEERAQQI